MTLLTLSEVAETLNVSVKTVRKAIDKGDMNAYKVCRVWRVSPEQKEDYLQKVLVNNNRRKKSTLK